MNSTFTLVTVLLVVGAIGAAVQVVRPLPPVQLVAAPGTLKLPGSFAVSFPKQGQAAVGEGGLGLVAATPDQEPVAIASLTKMMTAYLLLQAEPLEAGQDGPTSTLTAADVKVYQDDKAAGDSVVKVAAGDKLTERQLLEALLLPSADNIASYIAIKVAGSEAGFVKKMNDAAQGLGMAHTTYADASGANPATVSTAADQLRMAQVAMQSRPFREIVRLPQALLPTAGVVYNVNFMVGKQGMTGVKTGSTSAAGSCFVGSYPVTIAGKQRLMLGAVLGQQSLREALTFDAAMLHAIAPQFKTYQVPAPAEGFARLVAPWGPSAPLTLAKPLELFGYPGMPLQVAAKLTQGALPITTGQAVGTLTLTAGTATQTEPLRATQDLPAPDLVWRLHR